VADTSRSGDRESAPDRPQTDAWSRQDIPTRRRYGHQGRAEKRAARQVSHNWAAVYHGQMKLVIFMLLAWTAFAQQPTYDLILKGGHVIDPRNTVDEVRDVATQGGKIAAVESSIAASRARKGIDVSGLVDIHVHVFWG
jgi:hypothetical protein